MGIYASTILVRCSGGLDMKKLAEDRFQKGGAIDADSENAVLSTCSSHYRVEWFSSRPISTIVSKGVLEIAATSVHKANDSISRFHVSMTQAHTIDLLRIACLGALLHLDENDTKGSPR